MEGRSPNENNTPSRALAASITTDSMVCAVWRKSRSAVSSGPKFARASTVFKSFFRLVPSNASAEVLARNQSANSVACGPVAQLLVSLVPNAGKQTREHSHPGRTNASAGSSCQ